MRLPIFQVDAFTDMLFRGNPAAVVPLESWLPDDLMRSIAAENALSETAFFVPAGEGWHLRWFTPAVEVPLCGHATLATAHVLSSRLAPGRDVYRFTTERAGPLAVTVQGAELVLDFPAAPAEPAPARPGLLDALGGGEPVEVLRAGHRDVVVHAAAQTVQALRPRFADLPGPEGRSVIVTAPGDGDGADYVLRYFAPAHGIDEDPVTGSAQCTLAPYWSARLGRNRLVAHQVSRRGGRLTCTVDGARVRIGGRAVSYLEGHITV